MGFFDYLGLAFLYKKLFGKKNNTASQTPSSSCDIISEPYRRDHFYYDNDRSNTCDKLKKRIDKLESKVDRIESEYDGYIDRSQLIDDMILEADDLECEEMDHDSDYHYDCGNHDDIDIDIDDDFDSYESGYDDYDDDY